MMQHLRNPKNVKLVSLFVAAIFVLGCFALTLTQSGMGQSVASAASQSAIGVVNFRAIVSQSPDLQNVRVTMQQEAAAAQKDFEEKTVNMSNEEKQRYFQQVNERLSVRENELMEPVFAKVNATIQKVADKKGLSVVVHNNAVVLGGVDITDEVVRAIQSGK